MITNDFRKLGKYLAKELQERNLTQAELARMAGVTRSGINGIIKGTSRPSTNLLLSISKALIIPPEILYQEAGLLPGGEKDNYVDKINFSLSLLPEEDQQDVFDYINMKISQSERKSNSSKRILEEQNG